jgi:hypothetical protein
LRRGSRHSDCPGVLLLLAHLLPWR